MYIYTYIYIYIYTYSVCTSNSKHFYNILNPTLVHSLIADLFCRSSLANLALNSLRKRKFVLQTNILRKGEIKPTHFLCLILYKCF